MHVPDASVSPLPVLLADMRMVMFALVVVPFSLTDTSTPPSSSFTLYSGWTKHTSCGGSSAEKDTPHVLNQQSVKYVLTILYIHSKCLNVLHIRTYVHTVYAGTVARELHTYV